MKIENMNQLFNIGDVIYGFCNGAFGRHDYSSKKCVLITPKYAVFEYIENCWGETIGEATILNFSEIWNSEIVAKWKQR